ncbi:MAG TPA: fructosamine kinase family protein [Gammaproteobacteria bacterium]|nr:fructosamine kinase family protein [Gammaproteobacteria bacterium]
MSDWATIGRHIGKATGQAFTVHDTQTVGGGCINSAYTLSDTSRTFFVKLNHASRLDMFEAEAAGLNNILRSHSIHAPAPLCQGIAADEAYLVLEYLPLGGRPNGRPLGRELARMHRSQRDHFGWYRDNTIGTTPQINTDEDDWARFWQRHRLAYQLQLAARNGAHIDPQGEQLLMRVPEFFSDYRPRPSLLHGDLWSGNVAFTETGQPVVFDPAVYYGDRETDLAMSELFGGFSPDFYAAYKEVWPLDPGYTTRKTLYNLYHILNHFNLFGGGYLEQARRMIAQLLSEVR